ncbi:MAG TPA: hypothetical protein VEB64_01370 [Azospirillaceae bacterium]|nr:hypothetical protein [Azospirillaceae bacterium]
MSDCSEPAPGSPRFRLSWLAALLTLFAVVAGVIPAISPAVAQDISGEANGQFVRAMLIIRQADVTYDWAEEGRLLRDAEKILDGIIADHPDSALAVQLVTNQFIGDFDIYNFRSRVRSLACNEPLTSLCFLQRISTLLPPLETPITSARWDWLSLAVAYHHLGDPARAREIIAPFLQAVRRGTASDAGEPDLFVARALTLTGETTIALEVTRSIPDCSTRLYNLADIAEAADWRGDRAMVSSLAAEMRAYAQEHTCSAEIGLAVQTLVKAGREDDARALLKQSLEQQQGRGRELKKNCCPPELAVAAAEIGEPNQALAVLREAQDENPWAVPAVIGRLSRRGETQLPLAYAEQVKDVEVRAESYAELIEAALKRGDAKTADEATKRLIHLADDGTTRRPGLLAQRARVEKLLFSDQRWRSTYLQALTSAERATTFARRDIGVPLLTSLMRIETGLPLLD